MSVEDELQNDVMALNTRRTAPAPAPSGAAQVGMVSIIASIFSTLLIRIGARTSFVILSFWIGKESESAALVVLVIECFYISELLLAPLIGVMSDNRGRKPFMLYAPVVGGIAALILAGTAFLFPNPNLNTNNFTLELVAILLLVMVGRLLEGSAAALNAPSNLGYLTDTTVGDEKLRVRVLTAYEVVTITGIALAIPFGGFVWSLIGRAGFFVAIAVYALCYIVIGLWMKESLNRTHEAGQHGSIREYKEIITNKRIFTFVPAWLAVNAMIGAWLTLSLIILAYPTNICRVAVTKVTEDIKPAVQAFSETYCAIHPGEMNADARFPNQLLHGGFLPGEASYLVGAFGLIFILGMGLWTVFVPKMRRTSVMIFSLVGLVASCTTLLFVNALGDNPLTISDGARNELWFLVPICFVSIVVMSGFTPAALTHMAAISETIPGKRGAVMGLYSVLLGVGQLFGVFIGGLFVDWQGFTGLMIYSLILALVSAGSVIYMRSHKHDIDDHLVAGKVGH